MLPGNNSSEKQIIQEHGYNLTFSRIMVRDIEQQSSRVISSPKFYEGDGMISTLRVPGLEEYISQWIHVCWTWPLLDTSKEKAMATYSSTLAWKIPWTEEPGRLQSMGSRRVVHDWATSLSLFTFMHWRRKWQPTPVFLPEESQGQGSLVGCRLWGRTELDWSDLAAAAAAAEHTSKKC